jgi:putative transferase (TIGR04331 family)
MKKIYFFEKLINQSGKFIPFADWSIDDRDFIKYFQKKKKINYHTKNFFIKNKKKEVLLINKYIKIIFSQLYKILNDYHKINFTKKYWKIVLYPWLNLYLPFIYLKWKLLDYKKNYNKYLFYSYDYRDKDFIIDSLDDFKFDEDEHLFFLNKACEYKRIRLKKVKKKRVNRKNNLKKNNFLNVFFKFYFLFYKKIFKNKKFFFINSNFKKKDLFFYYFRNLELPFLYRKLDYKKNKINLNSRNFIFKKINSKNNNFLKYFIDNLKIVTPKSYIEDFDNIRKLVHEYYPMNKKMNFYTAFSYKKDDIFKIWIAENSLKGSKYNIVQHGGAFGIDEIVNEENYIREISDKFLTWGWKDNKKTIPFYNIKLPNRSNIRDKYYVKSSPKKKILIIFHHYNKFISRITSQPNTNYERMDKISKLVQICQELENMFDVTIRYRQIADKNWDSKLNKSLFSQKIKFDNGKEKFEKIIYDYDLIIQDSNSTTFLETCFYNIPSVIILDKKIQKTRKSFKYFQNNFVKNNIIFYDIDELIKFIKNIKNISLWWSSSEIQSIIKKFCKNYINSSHNKQLILKSLK